MGRVKGAGGAAPLPRRGGPAAAPGAVDRLIHDHLRLGMVSALAVNRSLTFDDLRRLLKTTDRILGLHARRLEAAEYIVRVRTIDGRIPRTEYRLTASGRRALERYLGQMEALIRASRER